MQRQRGSRSHLCQEGELQWHHNGITRLHDITAHTSHFRSSVISNMYTFSGGPKGQPSGCPNGIWNFFLLNFLRPERNKQEAQLSQRDRAMLRVIEYFAKSLKVIENDSLEKHVSSC